MHTPIKDESILTEDLRRFLAKRAAVLREIAIRYRKREERHPATTHLLDEIADVERQLRFYRDHRDSSREGSIYSRTALEHERQDLYERLGEVALKLRSWLDTSELQALAKREEDLRNRIDEVETLLFPVDASPSETRRTRLIRISPRLALVVSVLVLVSFLTMVVWRILTKGAEFDGKDIHVAEISRPTSIQQGAEVITEQATPSSVGSELPDLEVQLEDFLRKHRAEFESRKEYYDKELRDGPRLSRFERRMRARMIDIHDAVKDGRVELTTRGSNIETVHVSARLLGDTGISVSVPPGTLFLCNQRAQNMIVTRHAVLDLQVEDTVTEPVAVACVNINRRIPKERDAFKLAPRDQGRGLARLLEVLEMRGANPLTRQAAIWIATDNANYAELGILKRSYSGSTATGRAISMSHIIKAMAAIIDAEVDIRNLRISQVPRSSLVRSLGGSYDLPAMKVLDAMGRHADSPAEAALYYLRRGTKEERQAARYALVEMRYPGIATDVIEHVDRMMNDSSGKAGWAGASQTLITLIQNDIADSRVIQKLAEVAVSPARRVGGIQVFWPALEVLKSEGDPVAIEPLKKALSLPMGIADRERICDVLRTLNVPEEELQLADFEGLCEAFVTFRGTDFMFGEQDRPYPYVYVDGAAVERLVEIGNPAAVVVFREVLPQTIRDKDYQVLVWAIQELENKKESTGNDL